MKLSKKYIMTIALAFIVLNSSCSSDDSGPTAQAIAFEKLAGQWTFGATGSITLDGQDVSLNYPNFSLSFTDGTYQTTNGGELFKANGTWAWANEDAGSLTLDTGEEVTINNLTETNFRFSFTHDDGGIAAGTAGNYVVTVNK